jgi:hypothetical protein
VARGLAAVEAAVEPRVANSATREVSVGREFSEPNAFTLVKAQREFVLLRGFGDAVVLEAVLLEHELRERDRGQRRVAQPTGGAGGVARGGRERARGALAGVAGAREEPRGI